MFADLGFWELAVIGVMALIVLGPERLPGAARSAGKWVAKARGMLGDMKRDIKAELDADELASLKEMGKDLKTAGESFKAQVSAADQQLQSGLKNTSSTMDEAIATALGKESATATKPSSAAESMAAESMAAESITAESMAAESMAAESMTAESMTAESMTESAAATTAAAAAAAESAIEGKDKP